MTVSFAHPFSLSGIEGTFPAGTYAVEETREPVEGLSFIGYRRTKTTIELLRRMPLTLPGNS